ncbi:MAG TPA: anthranilate synthase component I [Candidatus Dormibacteraeota bacterium]|nr:anthranilate synthase component I [Candidatus Dormibacteraeota bacterium]
MIQPDFREFQRLAKRGNLVPIYDVFSADLLTPVSAYLRIAQGARYSFLLESVEGGEKIARYTFAGANPEEVFRYANGACVLESRDRILWEERDPVTFLRARMERFHPVRLPGLPPLVAGAIGYFSYDMVRLIERLPKKLRDEIGLYDAMLMFYHGILAFDHVQHRLWVVRNVFTQGSGSLRSKYNAAVREIKRTRLQLEDPAPAESPSLKTKAKRRLPFKVTSNFRRPEYLAAVRKAKEFIRAGDIFQVVISQRFSAKTQAPPFEVYRALRALNPSPYLFYLQMNDVSIVGSSPEMLVKVQGRDVFYRPIAGTLPRGQDDAEDRRFEQKMLASEKERAEHIMLVDLGRNDLGRVCEYGTVKVEQLMTVERFSHVMHLVSSLRGRLREDVDCFDALMACFPAGTVSGAPKVRAMEIIEDLERTRRGIYAGGVLYMDFAGNLDSCIALRTMVIKNGVAHVQAGGGIVADSTPAGEYQETLNKSRALLTALETANQTRNSNILHHHGPLASPLSRRASGRRSEKKLK